jgi:hypothetical protein
VYGELEASGPIEWHIEVLFIRRGLPCTQSIPFSTYILEHHELGLVMEHFGDTVEAIAQLLSCPDIHIALKLLGVICRRRKHILGNTRTLTLITF